jgi:pyruvate,orthophosphate dikinase
MAPKNYISEFGIKTDGDASMKSILGGKGANLAEMAKIGLPVPPGFTIPTEICAEYYSHGKKLPDLLWQQVLSAIKNVEKQQDKLFGDKTNPLLFSVRSGARESMPGMMDTILNLGLNDETVEGLANNTNNRRFALDCYRRFIQMYGDVVMGVHAKDEHSRDPFEIIIDGTKTKANVSDDTQLSEEDLANIIKEYKALIHSTTGKEFPQDIYMQLHGAIGAVFESWHNERAIIYRRKYNKETSGCLSHSFASGSCWWFRSF